MSQTEFDDTPLSRCNFYRKVCELPAVIDPPSMGRIIMRATRVWGVTVPAELAAMVRISLRETYSGTCPVIAHPRSRRWTFLTRPDLPDDDRLFVEMFRLNVSIVRTGGIIALPSPGDRSAHLRRWVEPPRGPIRPSGLLVVQAIRACSGRPGHGRSARYA
ncbi:DNA-directed RNA polymerase subunit beta [Nocardia gipuzkoensis]